MDEVLPVLSGIVLGLATLAVRSTWLRIVVIGTAGIALGAFASWVSGELAISWVYVLIDSGQVVAAGVMTGVLARVWVRRHARSQAR